MDEISSKCKADKSYLIPSQLLLHRVEDIKCRPQPQYESAGGLASRMIIESSSYQTTPCSSPPTKFRDPIHATVEPAIEVSGTGPDGRRDQGKFDNQVTQAAEIARNGGETTSNDTKFCDSKPKQTPRQIRAVAKDSKIAETQQKGRNSSSNSEVESSPRLESEGDTSIPSIQVLRIKY
jgi:hypothetical protein